MALAHDNFTTLLSALGEQLRSLDARHEIVVVGGTALLAAGLVTRTTRDVDVVALIDAEQLISADPLPDSLQRAADLVSRDFGLESDWLNPGPTDLLRSGLPPGFEDRLEQQPFGSHLVVHFAGRRDLIHLKLFAMADQGSGRHEADLRAMDPTPEELKAAASWARTHDPSPAFRSILADVLAHLGVTDDFLAE